MKIWTTTQNNVISSAYHESDGVEHAHGSHDGEARQEFVTVLSELEIYGLREEDGADEFTLGGHEPWRSRNYRTNVALMNWTIELNDATIGRMMDAWIKGMNRSIEYATDELIEWMNGRLIDESS